MATPASFIDLAANPCGCASGDPMLGCCVDESGRLVGPRTAPAPPPSGASQVVPSCYARALGDCKGPLSREHPDTEAILRQIAARDPNGLLLMRGVRRFGKNEIALAPKSAAAHILCRHHNSTLSDYDTVGSRFFRALSVAHERGAGRPRVAFLNGNDLEKWFLKVFCGCIATGDFWDPSGFLPKREVPDVWVNVLYGRASWPRGWGIYYTSEAGDLADEGPLHFSRELIVDSRIQAPIGMRLRAAGFAFTFLVVENYEELRIKPYTYRLGRLNLRFPPDTPLTVLGFSWWPHGGAGLTADVSLSRLTREQMEAELAARTGLARTPSV